MELAVARSRESFAHEQSWRAREEERRRAQEDLELRRATALSLRP